MINRIIDLSARYRGFVVLLALAGAMAGWWSLTHVPLDALPDLSDTQVIVYSQWDRSPDIIEDQVTYPIVTALLGAPRVKAVRGFSDFGASYVYVVFDEGTDIYWARSRTHGVSVDGVVAPSPGCQDGARTGCERPRLGIPVRARRRIGNSRPCRAPFLSGLVPAVLPEVGPRCRRRRLAWRLRPAIPGQRRSQPPARARAVNPPGGGRGAGRQRRGRRPRHRVRRHRIHGARPRLRADDCRLREHRAFGECERHAGAHQGHRPGGLRPGHAPRRRGSRWQGRSGLGHRHHAPWRERARRDRARPRQAARDRARIPPWRQGRTGVRPLRR